MMDGFELTESVRQKEASTEAHVPIVAITASVMRGELDISNIQKHLFAVSFQACPLNWEPICVKPDNYILA